MRIAFVLTLLAVAGAGCGSEDPKPAPEPSAPAATAPAGTPFPSGTGASLHAGTTYTTQLFEPKLEITPAPGKWVAEIGEIETDLSVAKRGIRGQAILAFHRITGVFDPRQGGEIPGDRAPAPDDFAAWLEAHPHLKASRPQRVKRVGLEGVRIDVRAVSHPPKVPNECGRHADRCVPVFYDGTDMVFYTYGTVESRVRFYVLELEGGDQLVVEEYFENPSDRRSELGSLERTLRATRLA